MRKKKIAICHYRVGGTDGVSFEIEKRRRILEELGCKVKLIAGNQSKGADYVINELEWDNGIIPIIKENGFLYFHRKDLNDIELKRKIKKIAEIIRKRLSEIQKKEKFDAVLIHNIFAFGGHIAAAKAFAQWIEKYKLPCIATHHDLYWEREEYRTPRSAYLKNYMKKYMPPKSDYIKHVVINSISQKELKKRNDIVALMLSDVFNFEQPQYTKCAFNKDFLRQFDIRRGDLFVLQATRIIPRKAVELAVDFVKELQKNIKQFRGNVIYNGKKIAKDGNVVLVMAGYAEDEKREYLFKVKTKAFKEEVRVKYISDHIRADRSVKSGIKKYSLWDAYVFADLVTMPSVWEGWGNQFVEAVFFKKPIVIFEYPVFEKDITKEGYDTISLGGEVKRNADNDLYQIPDKNIKKAVKKSAKWLLNENLNKKLERNFRIGKRYHDCGVLKDFLIKNLGLN